MSAKKTYVLDTNVLMSDPGAVFSFAEHDVIIPMVALEELDRHKSRPDDVGRNVRQVTRTLDGLRDSGSLIDGIPLKEGGTLRVCAMPQTCVCPTGLDPTKPDNMIISYAQSVKGAILVSKDINVRVKCDSLGVRCEDYLKMRVTDDPQKLFRGVDVVEVERDVVESFYNDGQVILSSESLAGRRLYPNQIVVIKNVENGQTTQSAITKCVDPHKPLVPLAKIEHAFGLKPRNKEQTFALDMLFDEQVKLVTLVGPAGCGKTCIALAAALEQLKGLGDLHKSRYEKLIVTRPIQPLGRDIGYLPGTLQEKMEPWIAPIKDNLSFLLGNNRGSMKGVRSSQSYGKSTDDVYLQHMQDRGLIEIEALTFIRGRSIPNAFIILDEGQNISMHELKTIITRVGEGSKIVMTGDIEQIDNVHVDIFTNGLSYAVEKFKEHHIAAHVTLLRGERSALATLASKIL